MIAWFLYSLRAPSDYTKYAASCAILSFGGFGLPRLRLFVWPRPRVMTGFEATARCFSTRGANAAVQNTQPDISVTSFGSLLLSWVKRKTLRRESCPDATRRTVRAYIRAYHEFSYPVLDYLLIFDGDRLRTAVARVRVNGHFVRVFEEMNDNVATVASQFPLGRRRWIQYEDTQIAFQAAG